MSSPRWTQLKGNSIQQSVSTLHAVTWEVIPCYSKHGLKQKWSKRDLVQLVTSGFRVYHIQLDAPWRNDSFSDRLIVVVVSVYEPVRLFLSAGTRLQEDSRCVLVSIRNPLRRSCLCLAYRPRKPPKFGPNGSPSARNLMFRSRSSSSWSTARRRPSPSETTNSQL